AVKGVLSNSITFIVLLMDLKYGNRRIGKHCHFTLFHNSRHTKFKEVYLKGRAGSIKSGVLRRKHYSMQRNWLQVSLALVNLTLFSGIYKH
ncbi:MAG: hypothetical protein KAI94_14510, partial [Anaerolineales bacterium]|nr:hypothetical protein [Anaerolineales bacterium]